MICKRTNLFVFVLSTCSILSGNHVRAAAAETEAPLQEVPATRVHVLSRGVNLQQWLLRPHQLSFDDAREFVPLSDADLSLIRSLGMTHVRLCIDPSALVDLQRPTELAPHALASLDQAIGRITAHDLAVIVDMHAYGNIKHDLETDDKLTAGYIAFWGALAKHLSTTDPERVFLEILNEPGQKDPYRWLGVEAEIVSAIRENAPVHTIIAGGSGSSKVYDLDFMPPFADRNVVYTIHYYEPMVFTHQGAGWGPPWMRGLGNVPFPATAAQLAPLLAEFPSQSPTWQRLMEYQNDHWDAQTVAKRYEMAAAWAEKYQVPVFNGEFGVLAMRAPPESRVRWLRDVRQAAEANHIGWCMWEFNGGFGLMDHVNGGTTLNKDVASALGLSF